MGLMSGSVATPTPPSVLDRAHDRLPAGMDVDMLDHHPLFRRPTHPCQRLDRLDGAAGEPVDEAQRPGAVLHARHPVAERQLVRRRHRQPLDERAQPRLELVAGGELAGGRRRGPHVAAVGHHEQQRAPPLRPGEPREGGEVVARYRRHGGDGAHHPSSFRSRFHVEAASPTCPETSVATCRGSTRNTAATCSIVTRPSARAAASSS